MTHAPADGPSGPPRTMTPVRTDRLARFDPPLDLPVVPKNHRLTGEKAAEFKEKVSAAYTKRHASINDICAATTRSYGAIHGLLKTSGLLRPRGGVRGNKNSPSARPRRARL
ncbi:helix-turn-helix domain-containing protein [Streptomyces sp. NPDC020707]|uniref:helix-turn-helix domain-containing protein n=1 Tax=Streptomyces sp. NPDC020707 TaxID=3365084 RepID=UPI00379281FF